jgi:hypothetical protein
MVKKGQNAEQQAFQSSTSKSRFLRSFELPLSRTQNPCPMTTLPCTGVTYDIDPQSVITLSYILHAIGATL